MIGRYVIVRTKSAGVHVGILSDKNGLEVKLLASRRIWYWEGAFTLSEASQTGIKGGKVSVVVPEIILTEAIEIIPCSDAAEKTFRSITTYEPR